MRTLLMLPALAVFVVALWMTGEPGQMQKPLVPLAAAPGPHEDHKERPLTIALPPGQAALARSVPPPTSRPVTARARALASSKPGKGPASKEDCETGCGSGKSVAPKLSQEHFHHLMDAYAKEQIRPGAKALESLLFYGKKTKHLLETQSLPRLPEGHLAFLKQELSRDQIRLHFRIKDEHGTIRAAFKQIVTIGTHYHIEAQNIQGIQRPAFGGKSKRVGLHHIWVRI